MDESLEFTIGKLKVNTIQGIIQGGMGVGISMSGMAGAVANQGGAGIISSVGLGFLNDYKGNYVENNKRALREEIRKARKISNGVIGVNILRAVTDYESLVKVCDEEKVDLIIVGAGLPSNLPELVKNEKISLVPIVSSKRAAKIITTKWIKKYNKIPDAFIVEGPKAGGHLGFKHEELISTHPPKLEDIAKEVITFANSFNDPIPVIVAGGIYTGQDIYEYKKLGAAGVQMGTRFVTTEECDAHYNFKQAYLNARKDDLVIIKSPVGMPGRAINNRFLKNLEVKGKLKINCPYRCLTACKVEKARYCIAQALVNSYFGDVDHGLIFCGQNAYRIDKIITVKELIHELLSELKEV